MQANEVALEVSQLHINYMPQLLKVNPMPLVNSHVHDKSFYLNSLSELMS